MPLNASARQYQVGVESSNGTAVAATAKLIVPQMIFTPTDQVSRIQEARGQAIRTPGGEFTVLRGSEWQVPAHPLNYEQLPFWLGRAVQGGITAVDTGSGGPYSWTYERNGLAAPALKAFTAERRNSDFTNHEDHEFAYCMPTRLRIFSEADGFVQLEAAGMANRRENSTFTSSLQGPTLVKVPFSRSRVYLNDDHASLGNTQLSGKVISWSWEFLTGVQHLRTAENNSDLDFDTDVINGREVGANIVIRVLMDKTLHEAELAKAESEALRAVRFKMDGASSRAATLDTLCKYVAGSLDVPVDEYMGQDVYEMRLQEATDGTDFVDAVVITPTDDELGWAA